MSERDSFPPVPNVDEYADYALSTEQIASTLVDTPFAASTVSEIAALYSASRETKNGQSPGELGINLLPEGRVRTYYTDASACEEMLGIYEYYAMKSNTPNGHPLSLRAQRQAAVISTWLFAEVLGPAPQILPKTNSRMMPVPALSNLQDGGFYNPIKVVLHADKQLEQWEVTGRFDQFTDLEHYLRATVAEAFPADAAKNEKMNLSVRRGIVLATETTMWARKNH